MSVMLMGTFSGCYLDDDNDFTDTQTNLQTNDVNQTDNIEDSDTSDDSTLNEGNTQFFFDVQNVISQNEDDEPLELTDSIDDSTNFDELL